MDVAANAVNTRLEILPKPLERFRKENSVPSSACSPPPPPLPLQTGWARACFGAPVPFARPVYKAQDRFQTPAGSFLCQKPLSCSCPNPRGT